MDKKLNKWAHRVIIDDVNFYNIMENERNRIDKARIEAEINQSVINTTFRKEFTKSESERHTLKVASLKWREEMRLKDKTWTKKSHKYPPKIIL